MCATCHRLPSLHPIQPIRGYSGRYKESASNDPTFTPLCEVPIEISGKLQHKHPNFYSTLIIQFSIIFHILYTTQWVSRMYSRIGILFDLRIFSCEAVIKIPFGTVGQILSLCSSSGPSSLQLVDISFCITSI